MDRTKYLMKNTAVLFISNFASKVLVFFLLPLYTSVLTTTDYGISDLITTTVHILYIFLTLYIANGIIRFTMTKADDPNEMFSVGLCVTIFGTSMVAVGSVLARTLNVFSAMNQYYGYLVLIFCVNCLYAMFNAFAKGVERIRLIGVAGIATTLARIVSNIVLLVLVKMEVQGYLISAAVAYLAGITVFLLGGLLKEVHFKLPRKTTIGKLLKYSMPIAATEAGWLICTSSDKYIVSMMLGGAATGIISAAHKLPTMLTAFTSVFIQAWTLSAIKEYGSKEKDQYYSKMFNYYNAFAVTVGAILILCSRVIGSFLFRGEFAVAWIYTPIYIVALVINTMSSFSGSIISAGTDTRPLSTSTLTGAAVNIVLDFILIKCVGIYGAGTATALSYLLIGVMRMHAVRKNFHIRIEYLRMLVSLLLLSALAVTMILSDHSIFTIVSIALTGAIVVVNWEKLKDIAQMMFQLVTRKKKRI